MIDIASAQRELTARTHWARALLATDHASATPPPAQPSGLIPFKWMSERLALSAPAVDALWLLASCELDQGITALVSSRCQGSWLSVTLLRELLAFANVELTTSELEHLIALGLVEVLSEPHTPLTRRSLRASDRVIELARGELRLDPVVARIGELVTRSHSIEIPDEITAGLQANAVVVARGVSGSGRRTLLTAAALQTCAGVLSVAASQLSAAPENLVRELRALVRECCLFNVLPLVGDMQLLVDGPNWPHVERELLAGFEGPVLATVDSSRRFVTRRSITEVEVGIANASTRRVIWQSALPEADPSFLDDVAAYSITAEMITSCGRDAKAAAGPSPVTREHVRSSLRRGFDRQLGAYANRISWRQTWDDLVLPVDQFEQIIELVARVRHRSTVLEEWGFADKVGKGCGVAALLSGPPGTGKTMVAGLIAQELGLDLYQVDLSRIVSKYIGETEKALGALFDAAESGYAVLLFDEADSLFAKRSEVKSSNDRYANLEVNFLLQRLEAFSGICLLTTNHESAIDEAFRRRLAIHVRFPMPDDDQREALWKAMMPAKASVETAINFRALAREFVMSGGYIKNAVLRAAYIAADQGASIGADHLWRAARAEYEAIGKISYSRPALAS